MFTMNSMARRTSNTSRRPQGHRRLTLKSDTDGNPLAEHVALRTLNETGDDFLSKQNDLRGSWIKSTDMQDGMPVWKVNAAAGVTGRVGDRSGSGLASVDQNDDVVQRTPAGVTHPVTAGIPDTSLSDWAISVHNEFTGTGGMQVLTTDAEGNASLLATAVDDGQRLVYMGIGAPTERRDAATGSASLALGRESRCRCGSV